MSVWFCWTINTMSNAGGGAYGAGVVAGGLVACYLTASVASLWFAPPRRRTARHRWHAMLSFRIWICMLVALLAFSMSVSL